MVAMSGCDGDQASHDHDKRAESAAVLKGDLDKVQLLGEGTFGAVYPCNTTTFGLAAAKIAKVSSAV